MAEWLYEAGIGEARAALIEDGQIVEARIEREGERPRVGAIVAGRLIEPGVVRLDLPGNPVATVAARGVPLGTRLAVEIIRMALRERGRDKPARGRLSDAAPDDGPDLRARIAANGLPVTDLAPTGPDRLEEAGWSDLIDHVRTGHWPFVGGALWGAVVVTAGYLAGASYAAVEKGLGRGAAIAVLVVVLVVLVVWQLRRRRAERDPAPDDVSR